LLNVGTATVSLSDWTLRDADNHFVNLTIHGSIAPGALRSVIRNGSRLSLDNDGDTIRLMGPDGVVVDSVTYGAVAQGELVQGH
jgi:lamin tail-like protein